MKALVQGLTSVETSAWEMPVIVLIRELAPTPVWPIMTTLKMSWAFARELGTYGGDGYGRERTRTDLVANGIFVGNFFQEVVDKRGFRIFTKKGGKKVHANGLSLKKAQLLARDGGNVDRVQRKAQPAEGGGALLFLEGEIDKCVGMCVRGSRSRNVARCPSRF